MNLLVKSLSKLQPVSCQRGRSARSPRISPQWLVLAEILSDPARWQLGSLPPSRGGSTVFRRGGWPGNACLSSPDLWTGRSVAPRRFNGL